MKALTDEKVRMLVAQLRRLEATLHALVHPDNVRRAESVRRKLAIEQIAEYWALLLKIDDTNASEALWREVGDVKHAVEEAQQRLGIPDREIGFAMKRRSGG